MANIKERSGFHTPEGAEYKKNRGFTKLGPDASFVKPDDPGEIKPPRKKKTKKGVY